MPIFLAIWWLQASVSLISSLIQHLGQTHWSTLLIGGSTSLFLAWVRRSLQLVLQGFGLSSPVAALATKAGPVVAFVGAIAPNPRPIPRDA